MSRRLSSSKPAEISQAEADIREQLEGQPFDFSAMAAVSNIYRAATTVRSHMESTVLAEHDLSWAAFTVLWVLWIWGEQETRHIAQETGSTKGTLTGVLKTLEQRNLVKRTTHPKDRRLVLVKLTAQGTKVIKSTFPEFNAHERLATSTLTKAEQEQLATLLRKVTQRVSDLDAHGD